MATATFRFIITVLVCLVGFDRTSAQTVAQEPTPTTATAGEWQILITPFNIDATDPWEYSRRGGVLSHGHSSLSNISSHIRRRIPVGELWCCQSRIQTGWLDARESTRDRST